MSGHIDFCIVSKFKNNHRIVFIFAPFLSLMTPKFLTKFQQIRWRRSDAVVLMNFAYGELRLQIDTNLLQNRLYCTQILDGKHFSWIFVFDAVLIASHTNEKSKNSRVDTDLCTYEH